MLHGREGMTMMSRVRWLLTVVIVSIGLSFCIAVFSVYWPPEQNPPRIASAVHPVAVARRPRRPLVVDMQPFTGEQLERFLADARKAEAIADPLKRCLAYPDPPGLDWPKAEISAYCHYNFDPWVSPDEAHRLIQSGRAAELDQRLGKALYTQLLQPGAQAVLDRTYAIDFEDGSKRTRALLDDWKRQSPNSAFALAASGAAYVQMAQEARGSKYASKTSQRAFDTMHRILKLARADLDRAVTLNPDLTPAYGSMIIAAALDGDTQYALNAANRGLAADPSNYAIYTRLVWMAQPKWGGSVELMRRIIASAERHADKNQLLKLLVSENSGGESYVEDCECDLDGEYKMYRQIFARGAPINMLMSAGWAADNRHHPWMSIIYRSELMRFYPQSLSHRETRAMDLAELGYLDWAMVEGNALVALAPGDGNAFDTRGLVYEEYGNRARAISDYEHALSLSPDDTWTLIRLGDLYVNSTHDWGKGWKVANRLIELSPGNPAGWLLRASIQKNEPRAGLDRTVSEFVARFGNDPKERRDVAQMRAMTRGR